MALSTLRSLGSAWLKRLGLGSRGVKTVLFLTGLFLVGFAVVFGVRSLWSLGDGTSGLGPTGITQPRTAATNAPQSGVARSQSKSQTKTSPTAPASGRASSAASPVLPSTAPDAAATNYIKGEGQGEGQGEGGYYAQRQATAQPNAKSPAKSPSEQHRMDQVLAELPTTAIATPTATAPPQTPAPPTAPVSLNITAAQPEAIPATAPPVVTAPPPAVLPTMTAFGRAYRPAHEVRWADPTNYGERATQDIFKRAVFHQPLIVLHETVSSADSAIAYFQTPHPKDADQASYHTLIRRNGTVVYLVPPEKRAFGAGNSIFAGPAGPETVKTHKQYPPSVNNFSYHISLESPPDGYGPGESHSGYTEAQYASLAWLVAQSTVPNNRITTHRHVDRSGDRIDPRSFDVAYFEKVLQRFRQ